MDSDGKFWCNMMGIIFIATLVFTALIITHRTLYNANLVKLITISKVSPIEATCALQDTYGNNPTCMVYAIKGLNTP